MSLSKPPSSNITGIVGLSMVGAATILSPTGFLSLPLCFLVPVGFGGLVVCAVSLAWKPRWMGVAGLTIGILCIGGWAIFFAAVFHGVDARANRLGMSIGQHTTIMMSAQSLAEHGERLRSPDGGQAPTFDFTAVPLEDQTDPWGRPYRYVLVATPRGYTFLSDGPDSLPNTADDIDLFTIQSDGTFPLPPFIRRSAPTPPADAPPTSSDTGRAATPAPPDG